MKKKTLINKDNEIDEDRTFFCSELVAKLFKLTGIIENDETSCSLFYPHHFCTKGESYLKLMEGVTISGEM